MSAAVADPVRALAALERGEGWPEPRGLASEAEPVPNLPPELLPEALRPWLEDEANRAAVPLEMIAAPAMVSLAAVVGRSVAIRPEARDNWTVVPNLWGAIVARPGALKSHCVSVALRPLRLLEARAREEHQTGRDQAEARRLALEAEVTRLKRELANPKRNPTAEAQLTEALKEQRECRYSERRYTTSDATVEKLGELLRDNPRGLLLTRDEVAGWLRSLDKPGREGDREFWLEAWNGMGSFTVDRVGRGTVHIPALAASIVGGIQPGKLGAYIREAIEGGAGADGLLQRVQVLVWPDGLGQWHHSGSWPDREAWNRAAAVWQRLDRARPQDFNAEAEQFDPVPWVRWAPDAQSLWDCWREQLERRLRGSELCSVPAYEAHASKYRSLLPSLALLLELAEWAGGFGGFVGGVSLRSAQHAAAWVDFLDAHARKVYAPELRPGIGAAHALLARIRSGAVADGDSVRDIYRHGWGGLQPEAVAAAIAELARNGWVRVERARPGDSGGRPSEFLRIHPQAREAGL